MSNKKCFNEKLLLYSSSTRLGSLPKWFLRFYKIRNEIFFFQSFHGFSKLLCVELHWTLFLSDHHHIGPTECLRLRYVSTLCQLGFFLHMLCFSQWRYNLVCVCVHYVFVNRVTRRPRLIRDRKLNWCLGPLRVQPCCWSNSVFLCRTCQPRPDFAIDACLFLYPSREAVSLPKKY